MRASQYTGSSIGNDSSSRSSVEKPVAAPERSRGLIKGHYLEIFIASSTLVLPMLLSSVVLIGLVYAHLMPDERSSYSHNGRTNITLGASYYVNYSATQLVFFSSISSTLAPLLFSPIMILFSYLTAYLMTKESDSMGVDKLPSPFQLVLLIKTLEAKIMSLWSTTLYAFGSKKKRETDVPDLQKAAGMLFGMVILAILIVLADIWLHIATDSVQYLQIKEVTDLSGLKPSRVIPEDCLNLPYEVYEKGDDKRFLKYCNIARGTAESAAPVLINQAEFIRTVDNQSDVNSILDIEGISVLGPADPPTNAEFQASSFGSKTACEVITDKCYHKQEFNNMFGTDVVFNCSKNSTGVEYWGYFAHIDGAISAIAHLHHNDTWDMTVAVGKSLEYGYQLAYFDDESFTTYNSSGNIDAPEDLNLPKQWWAMAFSMPNPFIATPEAERNVSHIYDTLGLLEAPRGRTGGIARCSTEMSFVDYEMKNGSATLLHSSSLNRTAATIATAPMMEGFGLQEISRGLQVAAAAAKSPEDLSNMLAQTYDQVLVGLGATVAVARPPSKMSQYHSTLVARVPLAPFWAVVALNLVYTLIGLALTIVAVVAVLMGDGVKDAQVRLSLDAVTAESFESPALGDDAKSVDELFAERRGFPARKIALIRRERGARRFKQIVQSSRHPTIMI